MRPSCNSFLRHAINAPRSRPQPHGGVRHELHNKHTLERYVDAVTARLTEMRHIDPNFRKIAGPQALNLLAPARIDQNHMKKRRQAIQNSSYCPCLVVRTSCRAEARGRNCALQKIGLDLYCAAHISMAQTESLLSRAGRGSEANQRGAR